MKNILVVNVNWLGDVIFSAPVFRALKDNYPEAKVSCMAHPRVEGILQHIPHIDEIIIYDEDRKHHNWFKKLRFADRIRDKKFDAVFILRRSLTRSFMMWFAGIRVRVGYSGGKFIHFLTNPIVSLDPSKHRRDQYLRVLESFGLIVKNRQCELFVTEKERTEVRNILDENNVGVSDKLIIINPGGNWNLKRWPEEYYARLVDAIQSELKYKVVISGGKEDVELAIAIQSKCNTGPIILTGKVGLSQLVALMERADAVVSADSGPLHVANGIGTDVVGIFGPTRPELTGPVGSGKSVVLRHDVGCNRQACYYLSCPDNICMKSVSVKEVMDALREMVR